MAGKKISKRILRCILTLAIVLVALMPWPARAQETVKLGDLAAISNAAIYIAVE